MLTLIDIEQILTFYDLGELYGVTQAYRGFVNETAFINTSAGRFVVRRNHRRLSEAAHLYRHALINRLVANDFPTPALVPTRNGETLLRLDGRLHEILTFVQGTDYAPQRPQQLASIGKTLAHYHQIVRDMPPPLEEPTLRYSPMNAMALIETLLVRDIMGELYVPLSWYSKRTAQLRQTLSEKLYLSLPHCVIHGDIHRDNILFANDDVLALLDFDQTTWDARLVDIADALVAFATATDKSGKMMWGLFQGPLDEEQSTRFIAAYAEVAPLTPGEITALPVMVELLWLQGELGRVISTPEGAPDYHQSVLDQGQMLSEWMEQHRKQLIARWNKVNEEAVGEPLGKAIREPALAA